MLSSITCLESHFILCHLIKSDCTNFVSDLLHKQRWMSCFIRALQKNYGCGVHQKICGYQLHTFLQHKIVRQTVFVETSMKLLSGNWALGCFEKLNPCIKKYVGIGCTHSCNTKFWGRQFLQKLQWGYWVEMEHWLVSNKCKYIWKSNIRPFCLPINHYIDNRASWEKWQETWP